MGVGIHEGADPRTWELIGEASEQLECGQVWEALALVSASGQDAAHSPSRGHLAQVAGRQVVESCRESA
jgi:hypothetical protein